MRRTQGLLCASQSGGQWNTASNPHAATRQRYCSSQPRRSLEGVWRDICERMAWLVSRYKSWEGAHYLRTRLRCPSTPCAAQGVGNQAADTSPGLCDRSRRLDISATARCQCSPVKQLVQEREPYLKSDKHDNPASQPVRMANTGKVVHETCSPP